MWFKNLFTSKQAQQKVQCPTTNISQFELQQTNAQSSPLVDQSPDLRYQNIDPPLPSYKLHFPTHLIHKCQTIILAKVNPEDGFTCRSGYSLTVDIKIVCTDKQILLSPNVFSFSRKSLDENFLQIPLGEIQKIDVKEVKKEPLKLHLTLKDGRELLFANKLGDEVKLLQEKVSQFTQASGINKFFAFQYRKQHSQKQILSQGWQVYSIRREFSRQGVYKHCCVDDNEKQFRYAFKMVKNHSFELSETYPCEFLIPFNVSRQEITKAARFRTRQRVPALTYFYEYKSECFATLFRCSQIKTGVMGNRCQLDEKIIREIAESSNFLSRTKKIYQRNNIKIYDARGYYAALGNMLAGKGYEREQTYNCEVRFLNIPNIHAVRDSYTQVKSANFINDTYEVVASSCWLEYVGLILSGAKEMAIDIMSGKNVLVHCSDGWDRTAQLSALCQLMLDPYFRTMEGFAVLIEKDWRNFGHKFRERTGQYHATAYRPYEKSPVFIQFLDCVYQLHCQFPLSFEYNSHLLQFLAQHVNSCEYGNFLTNNMKEANQVKVEAETVSIWSDILHGDNREEFQNAFYKEELNKGFLNMGLEMKNLTIWQEHLFEEKGPMQDAIFAYRKEKLINKALRQQFYANQKIIQTIKLQLAQQTILN